jgi:catechol 2,3-dioxygenase-like lactoylglutathione lyase family enzyme
LLRGVLMLAVSDVERSLRFYCDVIGFEQLDYPDIPLLRLGNLQLFLVEHSPPARNRPGIALAPSTDAGSIPRQSKLSLIRRPSVEWDPDTDRSYFELYPDLELAVVT